MEINFLKRRNYNEYFEKLPGKSNVSSNNVPSIFHGRLKNTLFKNVIWMYWERTIKN